jgi:release factor glutamine methyltransferase
LSEAKAHISRELTAAGIEPAEVRREIELIVEYATGWALAEQILQSAAPVPREALRVIMDIVERRKTRVPLQYLFGHTYFMGLKLAIRHGVLIPREDTETLVLVALQHMTDMRPYHVADIGIGSGAIALAILDRRLDATVTGIDVTADAICLARENALSQGTYDRLEILYDDWERVLPKNLDGIVSNPPYIPESQKPDLLPEVAKYEPPEALFGGGKDGLDFYRKLSRVGADYLVPHGFFAVEVGDKQAAAVRSMFESKGWRELQIHNDLNGLPRVVSGLRP